MPVISLLLLLVALLSSCATVPLPTPEAAIKSTSVHDGRSRALYLYSRARLAGLEGDYPAALNLLRDAVELDPSSAFLHSSIAEIKLKIGQAPEALEYVFKAIKLDPAYRPPYLMAGALMAAAGKDLEAAGYLRKAIALDPAKEDAYLQLAISLTRLFEYEEAVSTLKALIKVNGDSVLGYYYLGKTYGQMKLYTRPWVILRRPSNCALNLIRLQLILLPPMKPWEIIPRPSRPMKGWWVVKMTRQLSCRD